MILVLILSNGHVLLGVVSHSGLNYPRFAVVPKIPSLICCVLDSLHASYSISLDYV